MTAEQSAWLGALLGRDPPEAAPHGIEIQELTIRTAIRDDAAAIIQPSITPPSASVPQELPEPVCSDGNEM